MTWIKADDFDGDWYGYLTNQFGHIGLGVIFVLIVCLAWLLFAGEYPDKWIPAAIVLAWYLIVIEFRAQGWNGWDTWEDTAFVSFGVWISLSASQALPDNTVMLDPVQLAWGLGVAGVALAFGVWRRI